MTEIPTIGGTQQSQIIGAPTMNDILSAPNLVCECGNRTFTECMIIKKLPKSLTGGTKDSVYPIPVYVCAKCGKIPTEFLESEDAEKLLGTDKDIK